MQVWRHRLPAWRLARLAPTRTHCIRTHPHATSRAQVGYDALDEITVTRQLVIGGRSKYLINGKVAEPS